MKLRESIMVLLAGALVGCYTYAPVNMEVVPPGTTVRARLTLEARERLPDRVRGDDGTLEGELLDLENGALTLSVPTAVRREGFYQEDLHERIVLGAADVVDVERRTLNRPRTYALAGVVGAAVLGIAVRTLSGKTGGGTIDRTDPGPSANLIPLYSIRIR